ncbi:AGAP002496-PA-like protein [Anopheles sinensis]|uniref:AGAP002496-PA-like protein n=1 Tax=Anopheles sinensis TaxID=74873 RepID=A0A084VAN8_ANOSI|nr:AGAP002496-PA-like protein [Anopheles sinensis]
MDGEINLKSQHSEIRSFVLFINTTQREVDVFWVNYSARLIHYTTLKPGAQCMVNTYVTHPWAFKDRVSGERMHVRHQPVYLPEPWYRNFDSTGRLARKEIKIHFPVRTLTESCLWRILALVPEQEEENALRELDIPRVLIHDLEMLRKNKARRI